MIFHFRVVRLKQSGWAKVLRKSQFEFEYCETQKRLNAGFTPIFSRFVFKQSKTIY